MLIPKKVKHRKWHKRAGASGTVATRGNRLAFGEFGLVATTDAWMTSRQLEAARRVLIRYTRKGGRIWIRVFPDKPMTKKGNEIPMGGGKGAVDHYVVQVLPGAVVFEVAGIPTDQVKEAFKSAGDKLPVKVKVISDE